MSRISACLLIACAIGLPNRTHAQSLDSAEGVVRALYEAVTFPAGEEPDWAFVRSLFLPGAVIVLRTAPDANTVFDVDGFVADFQRFITESSVRETGFEESIARTHTTEYGDIAQTLVLYHAVIPGRGRPPQPGVDSFSLVRREGRWWIAAVTNELPMVAGPPPPAIREQ